MTASKPSPPPYSYFARCTGSWIEPKEYEDMARAHLRWFERKKLSPPEELRVDHVGSDGRVYYSHVKGEDLHAWTWGWLTWVECDPLDATQWATYEGRCFPICGKFDNGEDE